MEGGTKYVFSEKEITIRAYWSLNNMGKGYVSSWYLKQIIAPFGVDTITFNYNTYISTVTTPLPAIRMEDGIAPPIINNSRETVQITNKSLSQIIFPYNVQLNFNYFNYQRCDASGQFALKNIELVDSLLHSGFRFDYKYFTETAGKEYALDSSNCSADISKLKLEGVTPYNQFGELPGYRFKYINLGVPKSGNKGKDHWGYFNNKSNADLFPPVGNLSGADRNPDPEYMKAGTLTGVKYPDGSKAQFVYEAHDANAYYYSEKKTVATGPMAGNAATVFISRYTSKPVELSGPDGLMVDRGCKLNYTLTNATGAVVDQFLAGVGFKRQLNIPTGAYTLSWTKETGSTCGDDAYLNFSVNWVNEMNDPAYQMVGGLRIKQISLYDSVAAKPPMVRRFSYKDEKGNSSGFLMSKPVYSYQYNVYTVRVGENRQSVISDHFYTCRISEPINNLDYMNGSVVGYTSVDESVSGKGKSTYEFSSYAGMNYFPPLNIFPYADIPQPTWLVGLPLKASIYDESNTLLQVSSNNYDATFNALIDTAYKSYRINPVSNPSNNPASLDYLSVIYYPVNGRVLCTNKGEVRYAGTDSAVSTVVFGFDARNNLKTARTTVSGQLGKYLESRLYYSYDYNLNGRLKTMKDSGITTLVSTERWLITPTGESLTDLIISDLQQVENGAFAIKNTYSLQSDRPLPASVVGGFNPTVLNRYPAMIKLTQTVNKFSEKSVPLEYTNLLRNTKETIIWDDVQQTSLASVVNAAYDEIAYTSFETANNGRWSLPAGNTIYSSCVTGRKAFRFTGNITTTVTAGKKYIVTYWTTGNSATVNGTQGVKLKTRQGWNLYAHQLNESISNITVTGTSLTIDELRAYPVNARMSTQTPEPYLGMISKCDALNNVSYFAFDDQGRLRLVKDEYGNIVSMSCYGRPGEEVDCNAVYKNYELRKPFVQEDCVNGTPDTIVYVVPAGKYTSSTGQYMTDSLALDDAAKNGPAYANTMGSCGAVYAKIAYETPYLNSTPVVARFYSDAACTRPRTVKNLKVNYYIGDSCDGNVNYSTTANGTYCYLTSLPTFYYERVECPDFGGRCQNVSCYVDVYLSPGAYTIK